ncbi:hypothetical protein SteCoe_20772 [Stentor coeruleus]|uniref:Uncharacterized protein n=1 Tax=Stentor coeruleus TaxID=5963 RepID=A0A1R2BR26_9CILI|nr:hypothetical protein SteCoe_20772 [Stentor coeruleus]
MSMSDGKEPDIKEFIRFIYTRIDAINELSADIKQDYESLRNELKRVEKTAEDSSVDLANSALDSIENVEKEFRKMIAEEKGEVNFLKQQIAASNQDKMKIEQSCLLLGTRVEEIERNVGIELRLPSILNKPK